MSGTPQTIGLFYRKSASVVAFLMEEYGAENFRSLLDVLADGETIENALLEVYGFDVDGLDDRWAGLPVEPAATGPIGPVGKMGEGSEGSPVSRYSSRAIGGGYTCDRGLRNLRRLGNSSGMSRRPSCSLTFGCWRGWPYWLWSYLACVLFIPAFAGTAMPGMIRMTSGLIRSGRTDRSPRVLHLTHFVFGARSGIFFCGKIAPVPRFPQAVRTGL